MPTVVFKESTVVFERSTVGFRISIKGFAISAVESRLSVIFRVVQDGCCRVQTVHCGVEDLMSYSKSMLLCSKYLLM